MTEVATTAIQENSQLLFWLGLLLSTLRGLTPLLFAALAGLMSEKSGTVQIGLEGMLLAGALSAAVLTSTTGNPWIGTLGAGLAGAALASLMALFILLFRADAIIAGTATNLLMLGMCPLTTKWLFDSTGSTPSLPLESRFSWEPIALALAALGIVYYLMEHTRFGLHIKFAGEAPESLRAAGVSILMTRFNSLLWTGLLAGLGGASLSLFLSSSFSPNMSAGRGFMALAAVIIGGWRPIPTAIACVLIAAFDSAQVYFQSLDVKILGQSIPVQFTQILPYALTVFVLAFGRNSGRAPKYLGRTDL